MVRHYNEPRTRFTARMPERLLSRLANYLRMNKHERYGEVLSRNHIIEEAIEEWLQKHEKKR